MAALEPVTFDCRGCGRPITLPLTATQIATTGPKGGNAAVLTIRMTPQTHFCHNDFEEPTQRV